jgi:hypothetical protein
MGRGNGEACGFNGFFNMAIKLHTQIFKYLFIIVQKRREQWKMENEKWKMEKP